MKSRKALYEALKTVPGVNLPASADKLDDETYGKQSFIYVPFADNATRVRGETALEAQGFKVGRDYSPGGPRAEVQVSYFKGYHWQD